MCQHESLGKREQTYCADDGNEKCRKDQRNNETPPRQVRFARVDCRHSYREASEENGQIPPHVNLRVDLHLLAMRVDVLSRTFLLDHIDDIATIPQEDVHDRGSNREISADLCENLRGRKVWKSNLLQLLFIEKEPIVQNEELVVPCPVEVIQCLREPWKVLSMPSVGSKGDAESGTVEK